MANEEVRKKSDVPIDMIARLSPPPFRSAAWMLCLAFLLNVSLVSANEYLGPVFPGEGIVKTRLTEPPPLPRQNHAAQNHNPLLQRPQSRQVVFNGLDPVGSIASQGLHHEDDPNIQSVPVISQNQTLSNIAGNMPERFVDPNGNVIFVDDGIFFHSEIIGEFPYESDSFESGSTFGGPIPITFGMGLFDNLILSAEKTAFKTDLNNGAGSFGLAQTINWSAAVTPQGAVTAQYGIRTVQGDMFSQQSRNQTFMTAGIFRRFALIPLQGGVAVDWLHDHSQFGSIDVRQMRCELSLRSFSNLEYGFMGGFDVFQDRPALPRNMELLPDYQTSWAFAAVDVQDYYLLFVRKHLATGGQVEFRCGATARGDLVLTALGEAAISDRLAVNGGFSVLAPSEGRSVQGNYRESWSMSLGVVLYFRGGAMSRPANLHRPMFDVAGNNSLFTRIRGVLSN